ncbi:hypothetical protein F0562_019502 [Nyssa sinensis]|uniref:Uncharacterized protein n=1 Tax=Nyssa sinensis TaxID=561372 RepID=A0A5J5BQ66_9ASTE|nr:hypothetical protein F0562_019502 [Nyssa sinensis]
MPLPLEGVPIYTSDIVKELSRPFTRRTLTQSQHHVSLVDDDAAKDIEADVAKVASAVPSEDYLVDQMPLQYRYDPSPPHLFYSDPGTSSSSTPPLPVTREDLKEYFQRLRMDFFIPVL